MNYKLRKGVSREFRVGVEGRGNSKFKMKNNEISSSLEFKPLLVNFVEVRGIMNSRVVFFGEQNK